MPHHSPKFPAVIDELFRMTILLDCPMDVSVRYYQSFSQMDSAKYRDIATGLLDEINGLLAMKDFSDGRNQYITLLMYRIEQLWNEEFGDNSFPKNS